MLKISHLQKHYRGFSLDCSMEVQPGMITGLIGRNGSGKSTTFKALLGLIHPDGGEIEVFGKKAEELKPEDKQKLGVVFADSGFSMYLTAAGVANIMKSIYPDFDREEFLQQCRRFNLPTDKKIKEFSTGMKAKFKVLAALSHKAELLILDEPTVGLDPQQIIEIRTLVKKLGKKHTVILSSHILSEVQEVCDRVVIINHGQIAANDTIDNLSKAVSGVNRLVVRISGPKNEVLQAIRAIDDVTKVRADMEREPKIFEFEIEAKPNADIRPALNQMVKEHGWDIYKMDLGVMTLEDAFLKITMGEGVKLSSEKSSAPAAEKSAAPAAETTAPEEPAAAPAEAEKAETPAEDAAQKQEGGEA